MLNGLFVIAAAFPLYVATLVAELRWPMMAQGLGWIAVQLGGYGLAFRLLHGRARQIALWLQLAVHWALVAWLFYATAGIS